MPWWCSLFRFCGGSEHSSVFAAGCGDARRRDFFRSHHRWLCSCVCRACVRVLVCEHENTNAPPAKLRQTSIRPAPGVWVLKFIERQSRFLLFLLQDSTRSMLYIRLYYGSNVSWTVDGLITLLCHDMCVCVVDINMLPEGATEGRIRSRSILLVPWWNWHRVHRLDKYQTNIFNLRSMARLPNAYGCDKLCTASNGPREHISCKFIRYANQAWIVCTQSYTHTRWFLLLWIVTRIALATIRVHTNMC